MSSNRRVVDLTQPKMNEKKITEAYAQLLYFKYLLSTMDDTERDYLGDNPEWMEAMRTRYDMNKEKEEEVIEFLSNTKQDRIRDLDMVEDVIEVIRIKNMTEEEVLAYCGV